MSETPRTDDEVGWYENGMLWKCVNGDVVDAEFARELERENARLKQERDQWRRCAHLLRQEEYDILGCAEFARLKQNEEARR